MTKFDEMMSQWANALWELIKPLVSDEITKHTAKDQKPPASQVSQDPIFVVGKEEVLTVLDDSRVRRQKLKMMTVGQSVFFAGKYKSQLARDIHVMKQLGFAFISTVEVRDGQRGVRLECIGTPQNPFRAVPKRSIEAKRKLLETIPLYESRFFPNLNRDDFNNAIARCKEDGQVYATRTLLVDGVQGLRIIRTK